MSKQYTKEALSGYNRTILNTMALRVGIDVSDSLSDDELRRLIFNASSSENPEPKAEPVSQAKVAKAQNDRVWFKLMAGSQPHEQASQYIAINGENCYLKRNHWMKIKRKFLQCFENAVQSEFVRKNDDEVEERQIPRFNYQIREIEDGVPPERSRSVL